MFGCGRTFVKKILLSLGVVALMISLPSCRQRSVPEAGSFSLAEADEDQEPPFRILVLQPGTAGAAELAAAFPRGAVRVLGLDGTRLSAGSAEWQKVLEALRAGMEEGKTIDAVLALSAPVGAAGLFEAIREIDDGVVLVSQGALDDPLSMQWAADLSITIDPVSRGRALAKLAAATGSSRLVMVAAKGAKPNWMDERVRRAAEAACSELGLAFSLKELGAQELRKDAGALARAVVGEISAGEAGDGGKGAAFSAELGNLAERLLYASLDAGAAYVEAAAPPAGTRYGGAETLADAPRAFDSVGYTRDAAGRSAFWPGEQPEVLASALLAHVAASLSTPALLKDTDALRLALEKRWPASAWTVAPYRDEDSGVRSRNHLLVTSDAYLAGRGYVPFRKLRLP